MKREIIAASVAAGTQVIKDRLFIFIIVLHMYFSNSTSRINGYTAIKEEKCVAISQTVLLHLGFY